MTDLKVEFQLNSGTIIDNSIRRTWLNLMLLDFSAILLFVTITLEVSFSFIL